MKIKLSLVLIFLLLLINVFTLQVSAYSDKTTHPALTSEIVDLHNLEFSKKISDEFKAHIIKGSIDEDIPPRWFNHFYDPIYNVGYKGYRISKEWAQYDVQEYSWNKVIEYYATGDKEKAYYVLGHILHLIEDATVPAHTRNDTHAGNELPYGATGNSPYEDWTYRFNRNNINLANEISKNNEKIPIFNSLNEYFDFIANYSNNNFFSEDTIFYERYKTPIEFKKDDYYGYGVEYLSNKIFRLTKYLSDEFIWRKDIKNTQITIDDDFVLSDYWKLLSKQAVLAGVGIINLFHQQAEETYQRRLQEQAKQLNTQC